MPSIRVIARQAVVAQRDPELLTALARLPMATPKAHRPPNSPIPMAPKLPSTGPRQRVVVTVPPIAIPPEAVASLPPPIAMVASALEHCGSPMLVTAPKPVAPENPLAAAPLRLPQLKLRKRPGLGVSTQIPAIGGCTGTKRHETCRRLPRRSRSRLTNGTYGGFAETELAT
ncbi:MAG: hypothetical protein IPH79_06030 [Sphingomonadales bacterium]|nr:hypothetical protein [Sphingomonadales bacterium]